MTKCRTLLKTLGLIVVTLWITVPRPAAAHCDSIDGPVVTAAKKALKQKKIDPVLKWIPNDAERELKTVFEMTLQVRTQGKTAREVADRFFFETLVRLHREGEGAPYTGLKPAGTNPGPAVTAADQTIATGSVDKLANKIADHALAQVKQLHKDALEKKKHADHNPTAGRAYVEAYVTYIHFVENLHKVIHSASANNKQCEKHGATGHAH